MAGGTHPSRVQQRLRPHATPPALLPSPCCLSPGPTHPQLRLRPLRAVWLRHPDLQYLLERSLTRKPPSNDDLKSLLPCVWWPGAV